MAARRPPGRGTAARAAVPPPGAPLAAGAWPATPGARLPRRGNAAHRDGRPRRPVPCVGRTPPRQDRRRWPRWPATAVTVRRRGGCERMVTGRGPRRPGAPLTAGDVSPPAMAVTRSWPERPAAAGSPPLAGAGGCRAPADRRLGLPLPSPPTAASPVANGRPAAEATRWLPRAPLAVGGAAPQHPGCNAGGQPGPRGRRGCLSPWRAALAALQ
jgi:hypothetical protein